MFNLIHLCADTRFVFERFVTLGGLRENLARAKVLHAAERLLQDTQLQLKVLKQLGDVYCLLDAETSSI